MKQQAILAKDFVLADGKKISDMSALLKELENMNERTFRAHVSDVHNDFADWAEDILGERMLANELRVAESNIELMEMVRKHLNSVPEKKKAEEKVEEPKVQISEVVEEATASVSPDTLSFDYHEDSAPAIQTEIHDASEVAEQSQTIDAATIVPENMVLDDPSKAPVLEFSKEESEEPHSMVFTEPAAAQSFAMELPASTATLPAPKIGIQKTVNPFMFQVMLVYRYLLMILTLGRFKIEPVTDKQIITPELPPSLMDPGQN